MEPILNLKMMGLMCNGSLHISKNADTLIFKKVCHGAQI